MLGETKNEAQLMYLKKTEEHSDGLKRNPIKEESLADALKNHFALPSYENTSTKPWITQKQPAKTGDMPDETGDTSLTKLWRKIQISPNTKKKHLGNFLGMAKHSKHILGLWPKEVFSSVAR